MSEERVLSEEAVCARAGCREPAIALIRWRNPRIHQEGRTKTWAACDDHLAYLRDYLSSRGFPVRVDPLDPSCPGGTVDEGRP